MVWAYVLGSVVAVSLVSVIAALPLLIRKDLPKSLLLFLLSFSVGTLLGVVFLHFLPEAYVLQSENGLLVGLLVLFGFLSFFLLEKIIHYHHGHHKEQVGEGHGHAYHLAPLNLIGDGVHNFLDGLVIAGAYLVSIPLGIAATLSVMFHELPQEIADFAILLYSGLSKTKALIFNAFSAAMAILGGILGLVLFEFFEGFSQFIIPFAAGTFLYIASASLVPELHKTKKTLSPILQVCAIVLGIALMVLISYIE